MNESQVFANALKLATPAEQAAYLDAACAGDPQLRADVEALLRAHASDPGFLEQPAASLAGTVEASPTGDGPDEPRAAASHPTEKPGAVLTGRYRLLERIGAGGMGVVWMAEQQEPVRRLVAVKLIKAGMDSQAVVARFEAERQALALMDHPNIAKVFDAGATASGRPYFVMELIHGVPITRYCDENRLTPRQRLGLFVPVCQAVQHAHHKGVIHRDLKPSNVLVALCDDRPVPKVIDFGVAKATGQFTDETLHTGPGVVVGTLEYMSPEQAEVNQLDVDTRSDVYSLGVLLYELLAGSPPFTRKGREQPGVLEMLRVIREQEPARPSARLSTAEGLPTLAANRGTEPAKLTRLVRGELDWIVMKALEKDRTRRYDTASALAADVRRYLDDEPVLAGPPGAGYRLRKFARRHRGPVLAATVVLLALMAGMVGTTLGLVEARAARQDAETNADKATEEQGKAKAQLQRAETQLLRAEWLLYASQINLAQQAWESNNGFLAYHHLDSCRRDFRGWEHDYLFTLFNHNQRTFRGHTLGVDSVAVSPDGKRLVSGSRDKMVKVWDAATGQVIRTLQGHGAAVDCVALSPDGKRIVSGSVDKTVRVWEAATGLPIRTLRGHTNAVRRVALMPDGRRIVSGDTHGTIKVWDAATGLVTLTFTVGRTIIFSLAVSPDGKHIVSGDSEGRIKVSDAATGQVTRTLQGHTDRVTSVAVSPDGTHIISGSWDKTVKVWDAATGREIRSLKGHRFYVNCLALSPDGKRIVSGSQDSTLKEWDTATGQELRTLKGHRHGVASVALSRDGQHIVSGSGDGTVKVWGPAAGQEPLKVKRLTGEYVVAVSADATRIIRTHPDETMKLCEAATGRVIRTVGRHTKRITSLALSPDGTHLASASQDRTIKVWDVATGQEVLTLQDDSGFITALALRADGKLLLSSHQDRTVKVWDTGTGQVIRTLMGHTFEVYGLAFSTDGTRILSGSRDRTVRVWDAATCREIRSLKGHTGAVMSVAEMPDGKRLVSGSADRTIKVWDTATGFETLTVRGHTNAITSLAVSPDGKRLVSWSEDWTLRVWDASMSQPNP